MRSQANDIIYTANVKRWYKFSGNGWQRIRFRWDEMRGDIPGCLAYERFIRNASLISSSERTSQGYRQKREIEFESHYRRCEFHRDWRMMLDCPKASSPNELEEETYNKSICIAFCLHSKETGPIIPLLLPRPRFEMSCWYSSSPLIARPTDSPRPSAAQSPTQTQTMI